MKLLQTLESIDDKLGKLLDRMSEGTVHTNQGEMHAARTVSSPDRKMTATTAARLDTIRALDMLSNTVSKLKEEYKELQEYKEHSTKSVPKSKEREGLSEEYTNVSKYLENTMK